MDSQLQHYRFQKVLTFAVILILILQGCNSDKGLTLNPTQNDPQLDDLIEFQMILVAGGSLILGDTWGDGLDIEKPAHLVKLDSFYIGNLEVSQFQYEALMGENPSTFVGNDLPVQSVSWFKAVDYCNKLSINDGFVPCYDLTQSPVTWDTLANGYRLPTEAEWEFAARGGDLSQVFKYAGSNTPTDVARFGYPPPAVCSTLKCGRLQPNELNLYDMSGNVWEWCWDMYGTYSAVAQINPKGTTQGFDRCIRGGGFYHTDYFCRVSARGCFEPSSNLAGNGLRLVRNR